MSNIKLIHSIIYQIPNYQIDMIYEDAEYDLHPYLDDSSVEIIKDKIHITFERAMNSNNEQQAVDAAADYIHQHYKNRTDWTVLNVVNDEIEWIAITLIDYTIELF